jgi:hypothetical protein
MRLIPVTDPKAVPLALAGALLVALASSAWGQGSNTATTRTFTSEWTCSNGRTVFVNAHPRRPREVSHISYFGNRVALKPQGPAKDGRHVSADGKVVWQYQGNEGQLSFGGLLPEPITCTRNPNTSTKK